jgi:dGTPase
MEWENLIKPFRLGCPKESTCQNPDRSEFQRDFDRIIFSTAFRRLNGKTQVFPFPETDIIHTRLTHSLEAATVGRSLGAMVGKQISNINKAIDSSDIAAIVSSASLAHDIGNPPLGHSGEKAFQEYFLSKRGNAILKELTTEQKEDFIKFDGNAMGFHMLTYSDSDKTSVTGGLALTLPTLAAFVKYPRATFHEKEEEKASEKKGGLFFNDIEKFAYSGASDQ